MQGGDTFGQQCCCCYMPWPHIAADSLTAEAQAECSTDLSLLAEAGGLYGGLGICVAFGHTDPGIRVNQI